MERFYEYNTPFHLLKKALVYSECETILVDECICRGGNEILILDILEILLMVCHFKCDVMQAEFQSLGYHGGSVLVFSSQVPQPNLPKVSRRT